MAYDQHPTFKSARTQGYEENKAVTFICELAAADPDELYLRLQKMAD